MKKLATFIFLALRITAQCSNYAYIPDSLFRVYINSVAPGAMVGDSLNTTNTTVRALSSVNVSGLGLTSIEGIEYFTSLQSLNAANNQITVLPNLSATINYLNIDSNQLLVVPVLPAGLNAFYCNTNQLVEVNPLPAHLHIFDCRNNKLLCLPLLPDSVLQLQAAQNYMSCLPNIPTVATFTADIATHGGTYYVCPDTVCSRYTTISGYAFLDLNHNGTRDSGEPGLSNRIITLQPFAQVAETDSAGFYSFTGYPGITEMVTPDSLTRATVSPGYINVLLNNPCEVDTNVNFAYYYPLTDSFSDIRVLATEIIYPVPGQISEYGITVNNLGTRTEHGRLVFIISPQFTYASSNPVASTLGDTLIWNFSNLYPATSLYYTVQLNTNRTDFVGQHFQLTAYGSIVNTDSVPANNLFVIKDTIIGSQSRFLKTVIPAYYNAADFDSGVYFNFNLTYQNQDTAQKTHVWLIDTLNPLFDMSTLYVVAASSNYQLSITGNLLRVDFTNIVLPDSAQNEVTSHGFFNFMIRPYTASYLGTIHNEAAVYFDNDSIPYSHSGTMMNVCFSNLTIGFYTDLKLLIIAVPMYWAVQPLMPTMARRLTGMPGIRVAMLRSIVT